MTQQQPRIAFIGSGNMANSIIGGLLAEGFAAANIYATARSDASLARAQSLGAITVSTDNAAAIEFADVVVLAVKPQMMKDLVKEHAEALRSKLVISVAAGVTASSLADWIGGQCAIVRSMPNTPSQLRAGATGLYANTECSVVQKALAEQIMSAVGVAMWCDDEEQLHAVTALSGCGPAYIFLFTQCLIEAAEGLGLSRDVAEKLALQTVLGSARMASETDIDVVELRRRVTSPNGVTERAIQSFEADDLAAIVNKALQTAVARSQEMSTLFT